MKQKFTLYIDADLIQRIKIQAILDNGSVSAITEEAFERYLRESAKRKGKSKAN